MCCACSRLRHDLKLSSTVTERGGPLGTTGVGSWPASPHVTYPEVRFLETLTPMWRPKTNGGVNESNVKG